MDRRVVEQRLRALGIDPAEITILDPEERAKRLDRLGIVPAEGIDYTPPEEGGWTEWLSVSSSNVGAIRWHEWEEQLQVRFLSGSVYEYDRVSRRVFEAFAAAPSKGRYLDRVIKKGGYAYRPLA